MILADLFSLIREWTVMMGEIILCDVNVSQGSHIQKDESFQLPHSLHSQACLQLNISKVSAMFLLAVCERLSS